MQWFRISTSLGSDPVVQMLSDTDFRRLIMLYSLRASLGDGFNNLTDESVAYYLRSNIEDFTETKKRLLDRKLIRENCEPSNWSEINRSWDNSAIRQKNYRERKKESLVAQVKQRKPVKKKGRNR